MQLPPTRLTCTLCQFDKLKLHNLNIQLQKIEQGLEAQVAYGDTPIAESVTSTIQWLYEEEFHAR